MDAFIILKPEGLSAVKVSACVELGKHLLNFDVDSWKSGASSPAKSIAFRLFIVFAVSHTGTRE